MSTTTVRLPDDLKARVARAAERAGTTTHSFILTAIAEKTEQEERRTAFEGEADRRYASILATGKAIPWEDMRDYLREKIVRKKVRPPAAKKLPL